MIKVLEYRPEKKFQIRNKLQNKNHLLQFLPLSLFEISKVRFITFKKQNLKTAYLIDIVHNLLLKYYFKKENRFNLSSIILKEKYGYLYNYYIEWLLQNETIVMVQNYKTGKRARVYKLNESIINGKISRYRNTDKILLKKWKNAVLSIETEDTTTNQILPEIKQKLVDDLFHVQIDYQKSILFLDSTMQEFDIYNKNKYSIDAIKDQHIFYHFDSYGRMHTNFTILKSFIRKNCLLIDGEETYELDIKNSQPLFLTKLMLEEGLVDIDLSEFELFKYLTTHGKFYQYIMDNSDIKEKSKIKELTYKVLFGKNHRSKDEMIFKRLFPTIHNFIKMYKKKSKDYKTLSHQLQRAESNLVFNKIIKEIMYLYPEVKLITVHDSIIFQQKYKSIIEEVFNNQLKKEFDI
jgi:hypothetical protein